MFWFAIAGVGLAGLYYIRGWPVLIKIHGLRRGASFTVIERRQRYRGGRKARSARRRARHAWKLAACLRGRRPNGWTRARVPDVPSCFEIMRTPLGEVTLASLPPLALWIWRRTSEIDVRPRFGLRTVCREEEEQDHELSIR